MKQLTYVEVIEAHRQKTIESIAHHYGVGVERVKYIGEVAHGIGIRSICDAHRHRQLESIEGPSVWVKMPPIIELTGHFEHIDNLLNRKTEILAGQCPDCGQVLMAEYDPNLKYRQR